NLAPPNPISLLLGGGSAPPCGSPSCFPSNSGLSDGWSIIEIRLRLRAGSRFAVAPTFDGVAGVSSKYGFVSELGLRSFISIGWLNLQILPTARLIPNPTGFAITYYFSEQASLTLICTDFDIISTKINEGILFF
ncbi:Unknown protein, partial [Striga hermonthica]